MNNLDLSIWDHAFVAIVLIVVFPFAGWWSYQRYQEKGRATGQRRVVREYQLTILQLLGLLGATLIVWNINDRPQAQLLVNWNLSQYRELAIGGCVVLGAIVLLRPILVATNSGIAAQMANSFRPLEDFLPKTPHELVWGILVSIAAGVCEEVAYRGFLLPYFHSIFTPMVLAIALSSAIFGAAHLYQGITGVITTGLIGALFAVLYLSTGSLIWPIIIHALMDISAMLTAYICFRAEARADEVEAA